MASASPAVSSSCSAATAQGGATAKLSGTTIVQSRAWWNFAGAVGQTEDSAGMNEQQRIVPGGCYQPNAKKLGIKRPDRPPSAQKPGWIYAALIVFVLLVLVLVGLLLARPYTAYAVGAAILVILLFVSHKLCPSGQETPFLQRVLAVLAVVLALAVIIAMIDVVGR